MKSEGRKGQFGCLGMCACLKLAEIRGGNGGGGNGEVAEMAKLEASGNKKDTCVQPRMVMSEASENKKVVIVKRIEMAMLEASENKKVVSVIENCKDMSKAR